MKMDWNNIKPEDIQIKKVIGKPRLSPDYLARLAFTQIAREMGYTSEAVIDDPFYGELRLGHGFIWSDNQDSWVMGCSDKNNNYISSVPIHTPEKGYWAKIVNNADLTTAPI